MQNLAILQNGDAHFKATGVCRQNELKKHCCPASEFRITWILLCRCKPKQNTGIQLVSIHLTAIRHSGRSSSGKLPRLQRDKPNLSKPTATGSQPAACRPLPEPASLNHRTATSPDQLSNHRAATMRAIGDTNHPSIRNAAELQVYFWKEKKFKAISSRNFPKCMPGNCKTCPNVHNKSDGRQFRCRNRVEKFEIFKSHLGQAERLLGELVGESIEIDGIDLFR